MPSQSGEERGDVALAGTAQPHDEHDSRCTSRQREALELHDGVVQGLVTAQLAHDLGRESESREAISETLDRAKAVVTRSLDELRKSGLSNQQLIRESASTPTDD